MRTMAVVLAMGVMLCGCSSAETFETLGDVDVKPALQEERGIVLTVSDDAEILQGDTGTIYLCDGYDVTVEILSGGNLGGTLQTISGYADDALTVIETGAGDVSRYECVWTAAGEGGDTVCRAVVLDDGMYHYCVCVHASSREAARLQQIWNSIFDSFRLA